MPNTRRRKIDPDTRDYVISAGHPEEDLTAASQVYLAMATELGSVPTMPWFGSRLHEIKKLTRSAPRLAEQHALVSVAHLRSSRAIRDVKAVANAVGTSIDVVLSFRDRGGVRQAVRYTQRVI